MTEPPADPREDLDALIDGLVAEYSDRLQRGEAPPRADLLRRCPAEHRAELERCLRMLDLGLASAPAAQRPLVPGLVLGCYRLERELGRGGMAIVFLARDLDLERDVAVKVLRPGLAFEPRHVDRFRREALAIAKLDHPNLVGVHAVGEDHGYHWLAMEYVDGPTLGQVLRQLSSGARPTPVDLARAAGIDRLRHLGRTAEQCLAALLAGVADGVQAAHDLGVVHRDIKPSNLLLHPDGRAVLADFGLARADGNPVLSITGDLVGTPCYMSPEQAASASEPVDHRTDVYSLGVALYEALTGKRPFEGPTALAVMEAIRDRIPPSVRSRARHVSVDAERVVERAMAKRREDRYESAAALASDLRRLVRDERTEARRELGGPLRRLAGHAACVATGQVYEYRSARTLLGLPLVHIHTGRRHRRGVPCVAKGWLAIGDVAIGGVALGGMFAGGILGLGGASAAGLFAMSGAMSVGLLAALAGGLAIGGLATAGGCAIGIGAMAGGAALGLRFGIAGGFARGHYAMAENASGEHVIEVGGRERDPEAVEYFSRWFPWLEGGGGE
jgi:serine/threonine protein kinase